VRDNRFYHAGMKLTMAFPKGVAGAERARPTADHQEEGVADAADGGETPRRRKSPREFLLQKLRGASIAPRRGRSRSNGMEGYAVITRSGSPLDGGSGPVRLAVLYRGTQAFVIGAASRSSEAGRAAG